VGSTPNTLAHRVASSATSRRGSLSEIRKKFEALSMVAKYVTGTYGPKPWAEVATMAACLRCHERRLLEGKEIYHGVHFDHRPHLIESRRGLKLRCTSCHSQIVQGSHISVTSRPARSATSAASRHNAGTGPLPALPFRFPRSAWVTRRPARRSIIPRWKAARQWSANVVATEGVGCAATGAPCAGALSPRVTNQPARLAPLRREGIPSTACNVSEPQGGLHELPPS
jgi:hypothetical protein